MKNEWSLLLSYFENDWKLMQWVSRFVKAKCFFRGGMIPGIRFENSQRNSSFDSFFKSILCTVVRFLIATQTFRTEGGVFVNNNPNLLSDFATIFSTLVHCCFTGYGQKQSKGYSCNHYVKVVITYWYVIGNVRVKSSAKSHTKLTGHMGSCNSSKT